VARGPYGYDPDAPRNDAPRLIADALAREGITLTDETVRKYLKEAATTVLSKKPQKS